MKPLTCIHKYLNLPNFFLICIFTLNLYYSNCNFELNNILVFYNGTHYRSGKFATNKFGDLIIEYSNNQKRLFFGFKKDGSYYFNTTDYENIPSKIIDIDNSIIAHRYEVNNLFIHINNDKNKEYLLSTGGFSSTEMIDLENNNYSIFDTEEMMGASVSSKVFALLDLGIDNKKDYIIIFNTVPSDTIFIIKLIKFSFTDFYTYNIINQTTIVNTNKDRIVSSFIMDSYIVVFYLNSNNKYSFSIYDFNLNLLKSSSFTDAGISDNFNLYDYYNIPYSYVAGHFFKSILLKSNYVAFAYYYNTNYIIQIRKLTIDKSNNVFSFVEIFNVKIEDYNFQALISLNDLIKLNSNRFILVTSSDDYQTLFILLFDIYNNYQNMKIRIYNAYLTEYIISKELSTIIYNDLLILTSTAIDSKNTSLISNSDEYMIDEICFSIFMIFGYINSTNNIIDISDFFRNNNNNMENNIISQLLENVVIDNNIFGYEIMENIKLVNIPESIIFFNKNNKTKLSNGDILNKDYLFEPNLTIVENDLFYYLEYQFIAKEPDYDNYNIYPIDIINSSSIGSSFEDQKEFYEPQIFYGKTNKAKFKLCEDFCTCCIKNNTFIIHKNCEICIPSTIPITTIFDFDYNDISTNIDSNTIINIENNTTINIDSNTIINTENNSKILFSNEFLCPKEFPYVIKETNECKDSCLYNDLKSKNCSLIPDKKLIFDELREKIITNYPADDNESFVILTNDSYSFQITTSTYEINVLNGLYPNEYNLSMIVINECENLMKENGFLNENQHLILLKYEKITNNSNEKIVQYEVYHPESKIKMDISICSNLKIDIYIPSSINESILYKYNSSSEYYNDLCYPYTTEMNTDILLEDRRDEYINNNLTLCEINCNYSGYNTETKNVQCKCDSKMKINLIIDIEIDKDFLYNKFINVEKYTNFYVIKCYKLLFCKEGIIHNSGNFIMLSIIFINIILTIIFIVKGYKEIIQNVLKVYKNNKKENENKGEKINKTQSNEKKTCKSKKNDNRTKKKRYSCMNLKSSNLNINNDFNIKGMKKEVNKNMNNK